MKVKETFKENKILKNKIPVYISITSIFKNQNELFLTLKSILTQSQKPDKIYIYLSEDKSFFDNGFTNKKITNTKSTLHAGRPTKLGCRHFPPIFHTSHFPPSP